MVRKARPNDPCPCGSGKKYKKCCGSGAGQADASAPPYTREDRLAAFAQLFAYIDEGWPDLDLRCFDVFCGPYLDRMKELPAGLFEVSQGTFQGWLAFDYRLPDGRRLVDHCLADARIGAPARRYLEAMAATSLRLYTVTEVVPGVSITLRDQLEGDVVKVRERTASYTLTRQATLAARVIPRGVSGAPELEAGLLALAGLGLDRVVAAVTEARDERRAALPDAPLDVAYEEVPIIVHHGWLASIFDPMVPELQNTDGDVMTWTRVRFDVLDAPALRQALDAATAEGLSATGLDAWSWSRHDAAEDKTLSLGALDLRGGATLVLEANSTARGERGRALVERLAGASVRHRATSHEDMRRKAAERLTAQVLERELPPDDADLPPLALDPDLAEALSLQHYAAHYRAWLDIAVPALGGATPRDAATQKALRPKLVALLEGLEATYARALQDGQPAYDASWMWAELGLADDPDLAHPPPLAHERVAERVPGSAEACRALAERLRAAPGFDDAETVASPDDLARDLALQRFLRATPDAPSDETAPPSTAAPYMPLLVDLELHRRKVFWVDAALSFMLESTDVSVAGAELRAPFPSFALALTDRHALSLGERLLARRRDDPLRGQILRVITVFATEYRAGDAPRLTLTFALDALGADLPSLVPFEVPTGDDAALQGYLRSLAPATATASEVADAHPARGLVRLALNAILYATSADVTPEVRAAPAKKAPARRHGAATAPSARSAETVYFLPGKIDIRAVRQLQDLSRAPGGRQQLARFLVRGHWRRAAANWKDPRPRWIAPHWKGPDLAAVIEKAYRLRP